MMEPFARDRPWFYAAALYNAVWGTAVVLFPVTLASSVGLDVRDAVALVRVIGMIVGVYAYAYYLLARDPGRYCGFIWIALAGKTLGPIGFVFSAASGVLPWTFGWTCLLNDVIWWPAFWRFAVRHARHPMS
jgi:hypothetical protein